jgi:hypothetical protein
MIAHVSEDKTRKQTVKEHLNNVNSFAEELLRESDLSGFGALMGLLHNMEKYSDDFDE